MADSRSAAEIQKFLWARDNRKLSTRDRNLINAVQLSPEEMMADMQQNMTAGNIAELKSAIRSAPTPEIRTLLTDEHNKIMEMVRKQQEESAPKKQQQTETSLMDTIGNMLQNLWSGR
jgi:hypothetical protein